MDEPDKNEDLWQLCEDIRRALARVKRLEKELKRQSDNHLVVLAALREQCSELLYCGAKAYSERARAEDNQDSRMEM